MSALLNAGYAVLLLVVGMFLALLSEQLIEKRRSLAPAVAEIRVLINQLFLPEPGHKRADRVLFYGAAPLALAAVAVALIVIPINHSAIALPGPRLTVGVFFYLVVLDLVAVALFMAGWGANEEEGTNGAFIAAAQLVSYVIPLGFAVTAAIMAAESMAALDIVNAQKRLVFGLWQPFSLAIYILAAYGQTYRAPVDLPLSGPRSNVLIEHTGSARAILRMALYAIWFSAAAMGTVLFLGGWKGPLLPGVAWFLLKTVALLAAMSFLSRRSAKVNTRQILRLAWLVLIPASILNVVLVGIIIMVAK